MSNKKTTIIKNQATRHYARVVAIAVIGVLIGVSLANFYIPNTETYEPVAEKVEIKITSFERSAPVHISIPKIDLNTDFVSPLGLNADRTVSVPDSYEEVGWYKNGVSPGEIGSSVILGHVDSHEGPAVFYKLGQLDEGDEVEIEREDGTVASFVITDTERVSQRNFPTEKVYGEVNHAAIRLVTCTGIYDKGLLKYSHNLIVYGELKDGEYIEIEKVDGD